MGTLIFLNIRCYLMVKISEEEYHTLELRIQTEVKRIFAEFLEDLERKNADSMDTVPGRESQQSETQAEPEPGPSVSAVTVPRKRRASKKVTEMRKLLGSPAPAGSKSTGRILEEDMEKIFRRKARRGAN